MNNKVIEVLDYMSAKLGIAIDWTAENVMPQVTEFMGRYRIYGVVSGSISVVLWVVAVVVATHYLKKIVMQLYKRNGFWYDMDDLYIPAIVVCGAIIVAGSIITLIDLWNVMGWAIVPEMKIFEVLTNLLENGK